MIFLLVTSGRIIGGKMSNYIQVKDVKIGEGIPKICIPIVEETKEDIMTFVKSLSDTPCDIIEWRVDWYEDVLNKEKVLDTLLAIRKEINNIPLLFTFRSINEGGHLKQEMEPQAYISLLNAAISSTNIDLIDVELFSGEEVVKDIISWAHQHHVYVICSNHDFEKTPEQIEILSRLTKMYELGADIPKIAVMPRNNQDVLSLLSVTSEMKKNYPDLPIVTMSMGTLGLISRLASETFGSAMTFGTAGKASAPGQISAKDLYATLMLLHSQD